MLETLPPLWEWQATELGSHGREAKRALFASPRLGKSRVGAEGLRLFGHTRNLVIAPLTVCPQWWAVLSPIVGPVEGLYGRSGASIREFVTKKPTGVLVLPDSLLAACQEELRSWLQGGGLIVDESHRFAGVSTKRGRAMRKLALQAGYVRLLSGTPTPNHAGNLWGQMYPLAPDLWGRSYERFANYHLIRNPMFPSDVRGVRHPEELRAMLLRNASIVRREDVFGPDTWQFVVRNVELPPPARRLYDRLAREWVLADPEVSVDNAATRLLRLQQLTAGHLPGDMGEVTIHSAKIDALVEDLDEIVSEGSKAIVFYRFQLEGDRAQAAIAKHYPAIRVLRISGQTGTEGREDVFRAIAESPDSVVAVVQTAAGGIGRSFAEAKYVMFLSEDFSFASHEQARDRVYKAGSQRVCTSYRCPNTVDGFIGMALRRKESVHQAVRNSDRRVWAFS